MSEPGLPDPIAVEGWPKPQGYSEAVRASGTVIEIAGQIGWDPITCRVETDDFVAQARQALANVVTVLRAAGAEPRHLTRLTWYITDRSEYLAAREPLGVAYRDTIGRHFPAMSAVVVAGLLEPRAKVEVEATAVVTD